MSPRPRLHPRNVRLQSYLDRHKLSTTAAAALFHVTVAAVQSWLRKGTVPTPAVMLRVCDVLQTTPRDLFDPLVKRPYGHYHRTVMSADPGTMELVLECGHRIKIRIPNEQPCAACQKIFETLYQ